MNRYLLYALTVLAAASCACSRSNNLLLGEVQAQVGTHLVRVTDCYRTSPPSPERLADVAGQPVYRYMPCRDADVQIRAGALSVNDKPYGDLKPNDTVLVDHGVVSINPPGLRASK